MDILSESFYCIDLNRLDQNFITYLSQKKVKSYNRAHIKMNNFVLLKSLRIKADIEKDKNFTRKKKDLRDR